MEDDARIEDLRRRIRKDPASIVFAHLAEELRRAGRHREAVAVCRTGLTSHPEYLSARVTLGQALLALDHLDDAQRELEHVRHAAPENLVATRALAEISTRRAATPARGSESTGQPATSVAARTLTTEITEISETPEISETAEKAVFLVSSVASVDESTPPQKSTADEVESFRMARTLAALESWLAAIYVARADQRA